MKDKFINNLCVGGDKCVLMVDGKYFGYDHDLYKDVSNAQVFKNQEEALLVTEWFNGKEFVLIPDYRI